MDEGPAVHEVPVSSEALPAAAGDPPASLPHLDADESDKAFAERLAKFVLTLPVHVAKYEAGFCVAITTEGAAHMTLEALAE